VFNRFSGGERGTRLDIKKAQGIPAKLLYLGMLWFPTEATKRAAIKKPEDGALPHFSSWSW
ncbi:hypothetical protein IMZ48_49540, partial [Candidatus Bathyarchaeota archaeon]|nr:hypothetical protein [Candidatus Bathyarchaeota archaeon]